MYSLHNYFLFMLLLLFFSSSSFRLWAIYSLFALCVLMPTRGIFLFFMANNDEQKQLKLKNNKTNNRNTQWIQNVAQWREITVILLQLMKNSLFPVRNQFARGSLIFLSWNVQSWLTLRMTTTTIDCGGKCNKM